MATNINILDTLSVKDSSDATLIGTLVCEKVLALLCGGNEDEHPDFMTKANDLRKPVKSLALDFLDGGSKQVNCVTFWEINKVVYVVKGLKTTVHNNCPSSSPKSAQITQVAIVKTLKKKLSNLLLLKTKL